MLTLFINFRGLIAIKFCYLGYLVHIFRRNKFSLTPVSIIINLLYDQRWIFEILIYSFFLLVMLNISNKGSINVHY